MVHDSFLLPFSHLLYHSPKNCLLSSESLVVGLSDSSGQPKVRWEKIKRMDPKQVVAGIKTRLKFNLDCL